LADVDRKRRFAVILRTPCGLATRTSGALLLRDPTTCDRISHVGRGPPSTTTARLRARRVARRLRRASELAQGAAVEAVKFNAQFRREFADILNPPKSRGKKFDFKDD
jgi:hypothetical protein